MKPSKWLLEKELIQRITERQKNNGGVRVLEFGCGRGEAAASILSANPETTYVGIEPDPASFASAKQRLAPFPNATILNGLAYDASIGGDNLKEPFDIVFSLSVLEHVKNLPQFLALSAELTREGGENIHLYDLGHSLYPSSLKERIQVAICASPLLRIVPETKVARYLATEDVQRLLESTGCRVERTTFHNMRSFVEVLKTIPVGEALMKEVTAIEEMLSQNVTDLRKKEKLFPSICLWTVKSTTSMSSVPAPEAVAAH